MPYQNRIRDLREDHDLTQKQVAQKLFMQVTQYRRYESGERAVSLDTAVMLAELYGVSLDYLAGITPYNAKIAEDGLSEQEKILLTNYRRLCDYDKGRIFDRIESMSEKF